MALLGAWDRRNQRAMERANERAAKRAAETSSDPASDLAGGLVQAGGDLGHPVGLVLVVIGGIAALVGLVGRWWRRRSVADGS